MPQQSANLNTDQGNIPTSSYYADRGDGTSSWYHVARMFNGGDVAQGATDDAAETDPSQSATVVAILKGLLTALRNSAAGILKSEDAAHSSGDAGVAVLAVRRDTQAVGSGTDGDYSTLNVDAQGRLRTADRNSVSEINTTALATNLVVKASAGRLFGFAGYSTTAQFVQVHDASSLPADTAVPELVFPIEANKPFSIDIPRGHGCGTGIVICISSTGPTKTIGSADTWITAYYE